MTFLKDISRMPQQQPVLFAGCVILLLALVFYNTQLGSFFSGMNSGDNTADRENALKDNPNQQSGGSFQPSNPVGMNSGPASAGSTQTITTGVPSSCANKLTTSPADLLPRDNNNQWGGLNPNGSGELSNINLLKAGQNMGVVSQTLRNANLQVRSEPANPQSKVSPWGNTTITPDTMRPALELGCGSQ